jgi:hypothetical protein
MTKKEEDTPKPTPFYDYIDLTGLIGGLVFIASVTAIVYRRTR